MVVLMSTDLLPVFVYGTLRNSLGNYNNILRGNTVHEEPATLVGATMLDAGGFPFVIAEGEGTIVGEVMYLDPENATYTMARLDRLEGYRGPGVPGNMYEREEVTVLSADGIPFTAHAYITAKGFRRHTDGMPVIETGDWKDALALRTRV
jgi:gamma-glutamylcyclotransferase (GGCT)/AIG2-like uncharacterized protein YtfP